MTKPRARDLGVPFDGIPGPLNAITDVTGVEIGHRTVIDGDAIRTGVTALFPRGKAHADEAVAAAFFSLNGCGEMTGVSWIEESGLIEGPILTTNTLAIGVAHQAVIKWGAEHFPKSWGFALPVVAETYDGYLSDIRSFPITEAHCIEALDGATGGAVAEGNVGGGTGMSVHDFKGGIGTASRILSDDDGGYTVGVLVQANHGDRPELRIAGVPVGQEITDLKPYTPHGHMPATSSIVCIVATDAPLLPHQCRRLAKRAPLGMARTGGTANNWSGDLFLAFSTANHPNRDEKAKTEQWEALPMREMDPLFLAVVQATEEAIVNALVAAETMEGYREHKYYALPHDRLQEVLRRYGRLEKG